MRIAVGSFALMAYLIAYVALAVTLAGLLPGNAALHAPFYLVAGIAWVIPIRPLMRWMAARGD